jgi:hypothetical protein
LGKFATTCRTDLSTSRTALLPPGRKLLLQLVHFFLRFTVYEKRYGFSKKFSGQVLGLFAEKCKHDAVELLGPLQRGEMTDTG